VTIFSLLNVKPVVARPPLLQQHAGHADRILGMRSIDGGGTALTHTRKRKRIVTAQ
jgi:hypothetical protein